MVAEHSISAAAFTRVVPTEDFLTYGSVINFNFICGGSKNADRGRAEPIELVECYIVDRQIPSLSPNRTACRF